MVRDSQTNVNYSRVYAKNLEAIIFQYNLKLKWWKNYSMILEHSLVNKT